MLVDERIGFITPKGYEKGYYLITIKMDYEVLFVVALQFEGQLRTELPPQSGEDYEILFVVAPSLKGQLRTERRDAPPILELKEEEKFTDDAGNVYEVEVRGERNEEGSKERM